MLLAVGVWSSTKPQLTLTRNLLWQSQTVNGVEFFLCVAPHNNTSHVYCSTTAAALALLCHTLSCISRQTYAHPHTPKAVAHPHGTPRVRVILRKATKPRLLWFFFPAQAQQSAHTHARACIHTNKTALARVQARYGHGEWRDDFIDPCAGVAKSVIVPKSRTDYLDKPTDSWQQKKQLTCTLRIKRLELCFKNSC